MAPLSPVKKKSAKGQDSEFTFHIIEKKASQGNSGSVAGAIVSGPVSTLIGDPLGSAFETATEAQLAKAAKTESPAKALSHPPLGKAKTTRSKRGPQVSS